MKKTLFTLIMLVATFVSAQTTTEIKNALIGTWKQESSVFIEFKADGSCIQDINGTVYTGSYAISETLPCSGGTTQPGFHYIKFNVTTTKANAAYDRCYVFWALPTDSDYFIMHVDGGIAPATSAEQKFLRQ